MTTIVRAVDGVAGKHCRHATYLTAANGLGTFANQVNSQLRVGQFWNAGISQFDVLQGFLTFDLSGVVIPPRHRITNVTFSGHVLAIPSANAAQAFLSHIREYNWSTPPPPANEDWRPSGVVGNPALASFASATAVAGGAGRYYDWDPIDDRFIAAVETALAGPKVLNLHFRSGRSQSAIPPVPGTNEFLVFGNGPSIPNPAQPYALLKIEHSAPLPPRVLTAYAPTTEQILSGEVRRRRDSFRFELCDREWRPIGEVHPDRSSSPKIENDTGNSTARRLTGFKLSPDEAAHVNTVSDRLRVYARLQNGAEFRLGSFLWVDPSEPERGWGREHHADLVDRTFMLTQDTTRVYSIGRGSDIWLFMVFICGRAGLTFDDLGYIGAEAQRPISEPRTWEPSASYLQILTDLGFLLGFTSPWFDRHGKMFFDAPPNPQRTDPTVAPYGEGDRVIDDSVVYSNDLLSAPTTFAAYDSGTDRIVVGRSGVPASAPHHYNKRGVRVGLAETVQGLDNQAQADRAASRLQRTSGKAFEWLEFDSFLDPRHETWDVVPAFGGPPWLETAWSIDCRSGGRMHHKMKRVFYE